jgi:hypothetical protein
MQTKGGDTGRDGKIARCDDRKRPPLIFWPKVPTFRHPFLVALNRPVDNAMYLWW